MTEIKDCTFKQLSYVASMMGIMVSIVPHQDLQVQPGSKFSRRRQGPSPWMVRCRLWCVGCAVIFASKRNEAKRKRNFFRFDAKKSAFFACFASMWNVEIWSETKMERSENKTKKKRKTAILFASKRNEAKRKQKTAIIFASKQNGSEIVFRFDAKTSKRKRIKWNTGTICKESKKNIKAGLFFFHFYT